MAVRLSLHRHWSLGLAVAHLFQCLFASVQCILVCKTTPRWKFKGCTRNNTSAAVGRSRCPCASSSSQLISLWLVSFFLPSSESESYSPSSGEGQMLCHWRWSVEGLVPWARAAHRAAGLRLSHEHARVIAPASALLNRQGWSSWTTRAEVALAFMQHPQDGRGTLKVLSGCGAWRTGLNPRNVVDGARVKLLIIFFLVLLEGLSGV